MKNKKNVAASYLEKKKQSHDQSFYLTSFIFLNSSSPNRGFLFFIFINPDVSDGVPWRDLRDGGDGKKGRPIFRKGNQKVVYLNGKVCQCKSFWQKQEGAVKFWIIPPRCDLDIADVTRIGTNVAKSFLPKNLGLSEESLGKTIFLISKKKKKKRNETKKKGEK